MELATADTNVWTVVLVDGVMSKILTSNVSVVTLVTVRAVSYTHLTLPTKA